MNPPSAVGATWRHALPAGPFKKDLSHASRKGGCWLPAGSGTSVRLESKMGAKYGQSLPVIAAGFYALAGWTAQDAFLFSRASPDRPAATLSKVPPRISTIRSVGRGARGRSAG